MNKETKDAITKYLQNNKIEYPTIVAYCGTENNNYVHNCNLEVDIFNAILDKTQKISCSRSVYKQRTYSFHEMKKVIITKFGRKSNTYRSSDTKEKKEEYYKMFPVKYFRQKNLVFVIYEYPRINGHEFPIISKYDLVTDESVTEFTHEKNEYYVKSYFNKSKHNIVKFEFRFQNINKPDILTAKLNSAIDKEVENQMFVLANFINSVIL
jgi:hypothetical protein